MLNIRTQLISLFFIFCTFIAFGQTKPKQSSLAEKTQRKLDSLLLVSTAKNQLIEKLKADNKHLQAQIDASKINQTNTKVKATDCSDKLAEQEESMKKQRLEIDQLNQKIKILGYSSDIKQAAKMYDAAAIKMHGEFARTNFGAKT